MPDWTRQRWLAATNVSGAFGDKTRSTLLTALDNALHQYATTNAFNKGRALAALWTAYNAWTGSKNDPTTSIRNRSNAVTDLKAWMISEEENLMPAAEVNWLGLTNCYAYSMKCKHPGGNQTPVPGRAAGAAVLPYHPQWVSRAAYWTGLLNGIVADAAADNNKVVTILRQLAGDVLPAPSPLPLGLLPGGTYLAAMVVKNDGFHFLRRDSATARWTHKNGAQDAEVETFATLAASGRPVPLTDDVFLTLVTTGQATYRSSFPGFKFAGYMAVPNGGFAVS